MTYSGSYWEFNRCFFWNSSTLSANSNCLLSTIRFARVTGSGGKGMKGKGGGGRRKNGGCGRGEIKGGGNGRGKYNLEIVGNAISPYVWGIILLRFALKLNSKYNLVLCR